MKTNNKILFGLISAASILDYFIRGSTNPDLTMAIAPIVLGSLISAGGSIAGSLLGGKKKTQRQVPLEPPEISDARRTLLDIAKTGRFGDLELGGALEGIDFGGDLTGFTPGAELEGFDAGAGLGLSLGDFDVTDIERQGLTGIERILAGGGGQNPLLGTTRTALEDIIGGEDFDPSDSFSGFQDRLDRELRERSSDLRRESGFTGNLFSTDTIEGLGDIQARGAEAGASELSRLENEARERRFRALPIALQQAELESGIELSGIEGALRFGGLERDLSDTEAIREFNEGLRQRGELQSDLLRRRSEEGTDALRRRGEVLSDVSRRRGEELSVLDLLRTVLGSNTPFGVPELTVQDQSPFQGAFDQAARIGGGLIGRGLENKFFPQPVKSPVPALPN